MPRLAKEGGLLKLGREVKPWGKVSAILFVQGERYYMLLSGKSVAFLPAVDVELRAAQQEQKR